MTVWREPAVFFGPAPPRPLPAKEPEVKRSEEWRSITVRSSGSTKPKATVSSNASDGPDLFVHYTNIAGSGFRTLKEDDRVEFEVSEGPKGLQAINVSKIVAAIAVEE